MKRDVRILLLGERKSFLLTRQKASRLVAIAASSISLLPSKLPAVSCYEGQLGGDIYLSIYRYIPDEGKSHEVKPDRHWVSLLAKEVVIPIIIGCLSSTPTL